LSPEYNSKNAHYWSTYNDSSDKTPVMSAFKITVVLNQ